MRLSLLIIIDLMYMVRKNIKNQNLRKKIYSIKEDFYFLGNLEINNKIYIK
jgi:hypothetical protein